MGAPSQGVNQTVKSAVTAPQGRPRPPKIEIKCEAEGLLNCVSGLHWLVRSGTATDVGITEIRTNGACDCIVLYDSTI